MASHACVGTMWSNVDMRTNERSVSLFGVDAMRVTHAMLSMNFALCVDVFDGWVNENVYSFSGDSNHVAED